MITEILIEQVNVSDDEYKLVEICCESDSKVNKGEHILSYESSKSVFEYEAQESGYFYMNPDLEIDESYDVGQKIAVISDKKLTIEEQESCFISSKNNKDETKYEVNFTKKAAKLFENSEIDISAFKGMEIVTEDHILTALKSKKSSLFTDISNFTKVDSVNIKKNKGNSRLAVIGAGNAALQLFDATCSDDTHEIVIFYETNNDYQNQTLFGIDVKKIIDTTDIIKDFQSNIFDEVIISFSGDIKARSSLFEELINADIPIANVIHKSAIISENVQIGVGNLIFANVRIGPFSLIGDNNVISANCNIEHNNILGDGNTFGPNVAFSGSCSVGNKNRFGTMIGIEPLVKIGSNSIIASGLILTRNIEDNKLVRSLNKIEIIDS